MTLTRCIVLGLVLLHHAAIGQALSQHSTSQRVSRAAFATTIYGLPSPDALARVRRGRPATCSLGLRAAAIADIQAEGSPTQLKRKRRQGRIIGRFLYAQLQHELESSEIGHDIAENIFDGSINVVDATLSKHAVQTLEAVVSCLDTALVSCKTVGICPGGVIHALSLSNYLHLGTIFDTFSHQH